MISRMCAHLGPRQVSAHANVNDRLSIPASSCIRAVDPVCNELDVRIHFSREIVGRSKLLIESALQLQRISAIDAALVLDT